MSSDKDELLGHNYDGIQEYDNDLPRWWVWLFWGCIVWGVFYVLVYHVGSWKFKSELLEDELTKIQELKPKVELTMGQGEALSAEILALASDKEALFRGTKNYQEKCAACHLDQGQGLVGPNLTDDYWIHGGSILDIRKVIVEGVPEKGMIPWGPLLQQQEINEIAAFVWNLHGTNPPNPKAAEGELFPR